MIQDRARVLLPVRSAEKYLNIEGTGETLSAISIQNKKKPEQRQKGCSRCQENAQHSLQTAIKMMVWLIKLKDQGSKYKRREETVLKHKM